MNSAMRKVMLVAGCLATFLVVGCTETPDKSPVQLLEENYSALTSGQGTREQIEEARTELIGAYIEYVDAHPEDSSAVTYLDAAATLHASQPAESREAIALFDRIIEEYPDASSAPEALFMKAYILNNNLRSYDEARGYYETFLKQYPDHGLAGSARDELETMGIPFEEIVESWQRDSVSVEE